MTGGRETRRDLASGRLKVDFRRARRRIEALSDYPPATRARALAAYVGVFDLADRDGVVQASAEEIAREFEISRMSWLLYRTVLEQAGLLELDKHHGGSRRNLRLLPPKS